MLKKHLFTYSVKYKTNLQSALISASAQSLMYAGKCTSSIVLWRPSKGNLKKNRWRVSTPQIMHREINAVCTGCTFYLGVQRLKHQVSKCQPCCHAHFQPSPPGQRIHVCHRMTMFFLPALWVCQIPNQPVQTSYDYVHWRTE